MISAIMKCLTYYLQTTTKKKEEKKSNHKDFIWKGIFVSVKFNLKECSISVKIKTDYKKTYIFVY